MVKIEHLGIAVKDLSISNDLFSRLLNTSPYKQETVEREKVTTSFFQVGESKIELLQSTDETGTIHHYIEKKGEGIHHIAFLVEDIEAEVNRMIGEGFQPISEHPKPGADNKLVFFFHPKSTGGVLIELCQEIKK
jgi:methylmalonyl-CoA/ethylmalonyl-CoA epimerase